MTIKNPQPTAKMLLHPAHFLSLGFGSGLSPVAPGTAGTLAAIPVFWLLSSWQLSPLIYLAIVTALFMLGVYLCELTTRQLGVHDHGAIVWDEIVGYLLTMVMVPAETIWIVAGFIAFRVFDIWKPWPIRELDRSIHGGLGIMLDDLVAAVYASVCIQLLLYGWNHS